MVTISQLWKFLLRKRPRGNEKYFEFCLVGRWSKCDVNLKEIENLVDLAIFESFFNFANSYLWNGAFKTQIILEFIYFYGILRVM